MLSSSAAAAAATASEQLSRQPSIYTLTLAELQNAMSHDPSKSLGSMNMEEFMRNLWTAEESQAMAAAMSNATGFHIVNDHQNHHHNSMSMNTVLARQSSLQRLMSLPPELSRNTVEEVWKDIQRQKVVAEASLLPPRQEDTLSEMTLEDFLARVGMVRDELDSSSHITDTGNGSMASSMYITPPVSGGNTHSASMDQSLTSHADWMSYNTSQQPQHHHQQQKMVQKTEHLGLHRSPMMLSTGTPLYSDRITDNLPDHSLTSTLALSPSASDYTLPGSRKRFASSDGIVYEKTVERRQKRMIKNRESAARSRARKQAYTVELETEVTLLKEENAKLKQQQALESRLPETWHSQKRKVVLRRTQSC